MKRTRTRTASGIAGAITVVAAIGAAATSGSALAEGAEPDCAADIDGDGEVGGADLGLLLSNWFGAGDGDLDQNGIVDGADLGFLLSNWGPCA